MTPPRSDHFNGKTFFHPRTAGAARFLDLLKWRLFGHSERWPRTVEVPPQPPPPVPRGDDIVATWIGHATVLLQTTHANLLIDPVFSERASPVQWAGPKRVHPPGVAFEALPKVDVVLLSHDHYDHCDARSLSRLAHAHDPLFIAPLRHHDLLGAAGAKKIIELDWWETHEAAPGVTVALTPSQHWSNRIGTPRNHRLWGGFFITFGQTRAAGSEPGSKRVWFAGDSGYDAESFRAVRQRLGRPELAFIPIGAYEPRWFMEPMHMNPAESVATHREVGARLSVAIHWGTFQLTDESRDAPVEALTRARREAGVPEHEFRVLEPGASLVI